MALNEQMQEAIQEDIADTRSKKERIDEQMSALKTAGKFAGETAVESIPGVSEGIAVRNVSRDLEEGDYVGAGIETLAGLAGLAPAGGDALAKAIRTFKPKKTVKAYKLFTKGEDGNLYPLFVDADTPIKRGEYIQAVIPDSVFTAPNGKKYVPSKGTGKKKGTGDNIPIPDQATRDLLIEKGFLKEGSKAKSVKAVALRPGWHAGDSPAAPHIGNEYKGKKFRAEDQVWAEVEMPADVDWQSIANKRAELKKDGTPNVKTAHITDELPLGGFYRYKTNPNMQGNWLISGQMKINRVLDADEVKRLNKEAGVKDLPTLDELKAKEGTVKTQPLKLTEKSPIRKLFDKLPKSERDALPAQPDENRIFGYHGTARARKRGEPFFDINFARKNDQFLGEGFYFTLDPKVADEYANLRAFRGFDIIKEGGKGKPTVMKHRETGEITTVENLMQGKNIEGKPLAMGQNISRFDLSKLEKPYVVTTEKQRKELKAKIPELKTEGYDSVLFADFKDRSKQIMVFPEHMDKINSDSINYAQGGAVMDDYQFAELEMDTPQKFAEGGMPKQMDMFDDGGLMQEGGTVDPESGNEVPVGSTQEEVRDDIPAQLSEGEFVFPADVVRYWGLDTLMKMRQQAKMGLKLMEEMGQMGNSEEATIPDDIPFDVNDLDMEDDGVVEYNVGGFVPQQQSGISGFQQSQFAGYQPQYQQYQPVTPQTPYTPVLPQQVPVMPQMQSIPTFTDLTGIAQPDPGGYDEMKTYVNDAGMEMQIPFKGGNPIYPIPEGYKLKTEAVETAQTTTTTGTGVETVRPSYDDGDDEQPGPTTGSVVSVGGTSYGPEEGGGIPGIAPGPSKKVEGATQFGLETVKEGGLDIPVPGIVSGILSAATGTTVGYNYVDQKTGNKVFQTEEQHKVNKEGLGKGGVPEVVTLAAEINKVATDNFKDKIEQAISQEVTKGQGKISKSQARAIIRKQLMKANGIDPKVGKFMSDAQIVAQGNINKVKAAASAYGVNPAGKSLDQIKQEIEQKKKIAAEKAAAEAAARAARYAKGDSESDQQAQQAYSSTGQGSQSSSAASYSGRGIGGEFGMAKGGLVDQMEKSGLTPKK